MRIVILRPVRVVSFPVDGPESERLLLLPGSSHDVEDETPDGYNGGCLLLLLQRQAYVELPWSAFVPMACLTPSPN